MVDGGSFPVAAMPAPLIGVGSWHSTGRNGPFAAAGPALRIGDWRGRQAIVSGPAGQLVVTLNDWCGCYGTRLLDLSDEAFVAVCGPLSKGVCEVSIEEVSHD